MAKTINYLNKDFDKFKSDLIEYGKTYFPTTYTNYSDSGVGTMFVEMASYIGDVMNFYIDQQYQESLINYAQQRDNIVGLASMFGYKHKTTTSAFTELTVQQLVPAINSGSAPNVVQIPDPKYILTIPAGMEVTSTSTGTIFRTLDDIDFNSIVTSSDDVTVSNYNDATGAVTYFLFTKRNVRASNGQLKEETFSIGSAEQFKTITLERSDVIEIYDVVDSNNEEWFEVPYLAQDTIIDAVENTITSVPEFSSSIYQTPYLMRLKKISKRFVKNITSDNEVQLIFGAGTSANDDATIIQNFNDLDLYTTTDATTFNTALDINNLVYTKSYGEAPANTTLTVRYYYGGGIESNVPSNDLTQISRIEFKDNPTATDQNLLSFIRSSVIVTNENAALGGRGPETNEEIRQNAIAFFNAQNRAVTQEDYMVRAMSLPPKFGSIAKAYTTQDTQIVSRQGTETIEPNALAINLYCLSYDLNGNLIKMNNATKQNLKTYINQYRMITDAINIKDAYIINFSIKITIAALPNYNKNEVALRVVETLKSYFDIGNWQINQPIVISELITLVSNVDGVQSIITDSNNKTFTFENKWSQSAGYSGNSYDMNSATRNGIVYPAKDPSIFEIKYPDSDILVSVI